MSSSSNDINNTTESNNNAQHRLINNTNSNGEKTTLWMGELEPWFDESAIRKIWASFGESVSVKLIWDKFSDSNAGYCFVDFGSHEAAVKALTLNGQIVPNTNRVFKLNWASGGGLTDLSAQSNNGNTVNANGPEYSIFVGDLAQEVTEHDLLETFQTRYPSCRSVKIMTDPSTNLSRGYGFVRFGDESHMKRSLVEMQGFMLGSRPIRISTATPKSASRFQQQQQPPPPAPLHHPHNSSIDIYGQPVNQFTDPNNTTVFVGGLSSIINEDELRRYFQPFGEITYVKIPQGKGCGFVQYIHRHSAEAAITQMQGYPIANSRIRLSWGRSQNYNNSGVYRPAAPPPPPSLYGPPPQMPPHPYGPYGPIDPQAAHMHGMAPPPPPPPPPPPMPQQQQQSTETSTTANTESVPVARLNELYLAARDGKLDRMEADSHGYHGVYAQ